MKQGGRLIMFVVFLFILLFFFALGIKSCVDG